MRATFLAFFQGQSRLGGGSSLEEGGASLVVSLVGGGVSFFVALEAGGASSLLPLVGSGPLLSLSETHLDCSPLPLVGVSQGGVISMVGGAKPPTTELLEAMINRWKTGGETRDKLSI